MYWYVSLPIQLNISYLFTQLNDQTVLFQTIQFSISHLSVHSVNVKPFYLLIEVCPVLPLLSRMDLGAMAMKGYSPSDDLMTYPGHSFRRSLAPMQRCCWCIRNRESGRYYLTKIWFRLVGSYSRSNFVGYLRN